MESAAREALGTIRITRCFEPGAIRQRGSVAVMKVSHTTHKVSIPAWRKILTASCSAWANVLGASWTSLYTRIMTALAGVGSALRQKGLASRATTRKTFAAWLIGGTSRVSQTLGPIALWSQCTTYYVWMK